MLDFVDLEADHDSEKRPIRDTTREFVGEEVRPTIGDHFENGTFPDEFVTEMGQSDCYAPKRDWGNLTGIGACQ